MEISLDSLSPGVQRFIQTQLAKGVYQTPEELVDAVLAREAEQHLTPASPPDKKLQSERDGINEINRQLFEAGVLAEYKLLPDSSYERDFTPIQIDGPPLSQTIIEERR